MYANAGQSTPENTARKILNVCLHGIYIPRSACLKKTATRLYRRAALGAQPMKNDVFDRARAVSAVDVAMQAGLHLKRKGGRWWTCCPFHSEKTPSCCFDEAGRFHCFGCQADGDSIEFYARLHGVDTLTAARQLAGDINIPHRAAPVRQQVREPGILSEPDEDGYTYDYLCTVLHRSAEVMQESEKDTPELWEAVAAHANAESRLENMMGGEMT